MTILEVVCPACGFSRRVPMDRIPVGAKKAVCPRCGKGFGFQRPESDDSFFPPDAETGLPTDESEKREEVREGVPWERRSELGLPRAVFRTLKAALFSPGDLFGALPSKTGMREPFAFGLLFGSIGGMLSLFWKFVTSEGLPSFIPLAHSALGVGMIFAGMAVLVPLAVSLTIFFYSGVLHLCLALVRGGGRGYEATFRVITYSQAASVWNLVPLLGGVIGGIWQLALQVIGLKRIHQTTYLRVFAAFLIPVILISLLALSLVLPFVLQLVR